MNRHYRTGRLAAALLWAGAVTIAQQPPQTAPTGPQLLHPMFQDHAVLQRDRPIKVYGETSPQTDVTVTLGGNSIKTRAGADGHWSATLPATTAGGPYTLTAAANGESRTASDVLVGDVFLCAGQSNMGFSQRQAQGAAEDTRTATDAEIRQLNIGTNASLVPRQTFASAVRWVVGSPETVGNFSAACYYFARELKKTANTPVGIVVAAWGGARVRNWVSEDGLRRLGLDNDDLDMLALSRTDQQAALRRWGAKWESWWKAARPQDGQPWMSEYDDSSWRTAPQALGAWASWNGSSPDGFVGQMWMRTTVTLTAEQAAKSGAALDLGSVNEEDETWVNGKDVGGILFCQSHAAPDTSRRAEGRRQRDRHQHLLQLAQLRHSRRRREPRHPLRRRHERPALEPLEVPGGSGHAYRTATALGANPRRDAGLQRHDFADRCVWLPWRSLVPGRIRHLLRT